MFNFSTTAFSEQYQQLRRQERLFRTAYLDVKAIVQELCHLGKISRDELIIRLQSINIIRNTMKREYKSSNDFFADRYRGRGGN
jgi:hypothetical protein